MAKSSGIKFRDSAAAAATLEKTIRSGTTAPIYLLMGEESYFIDRIGALLADTLLPAEARAFNQTILYGRDAEAGAVINLCRQMPMGGGRQVVVVREAQGLRGLEKLQLYTASPVDHTILVLCHKEKTVDKRGALYKSCLKNGTVFESVRPREYELAAWVASVAAEQGVQMDQKSISMLLEHLGAEMARIEAEITKLKLSLEAGATAITADVVERVVGISKDFNLFELTKAVATRDLPRALRIADNFGQNPREHPLLLSVMALFGLFREFFQMNYLRWRQQHQGTPVPQDMELMRVLRLSNPYALADVKQNSLKWNNRHVFNILGLLSEYDAKSKGMASGGASEGDLLRELILKCFYTK